MISERILFLNKRIDAACKRCGRDPSEIKIVAVSKRFPVEVVREAITLGSNAIGEGRVQEALNKFQSLSDLPFEKHMIGHLQTNKVKEAVMIFDVIQSLDSYKLAKEIDIRARNLGKIMKVMIEINISGEDQRHGISPLEVEHFYHRILQLRNIKVIGLMAMAPFVAPEETRLYFRRMKQINGILKLPYLSMGMSNDFEVAIEEGSNMIRIGTAIFGKEI